MTSSSRQTLERRVSPDWPGEVVRRMRELAETGVDTLTSRFPSWDRHGQLRVSSARSRRRWERPHRARDG